MDRSAGNALASNGRPEPDFGAPRPCDPADLRNALLSILAGAAITAAGAEWSPSQATGPDSTQDGPELEVPGAAGDVLPGGGPRLLQSRRPGRHASTRATARAPRCRWWPTAPMMSGFGDINALIELAAKKPDDAPIAVYVMFNQPPFTVAVKADGPIRTPQDLVGKTLGGAANDGALKLFPAFCRITKIDCSQSQDHQPAAEPARTDADAGPGRWRVRLRQHHPFLRPSHGGRGQQDSATSTSAITGWISIPTQSSSPRSSCRIIRRPFVAWFVPSTRRRWSPLKDPAAAVAAVAKREPLIKVAGGEGRHPTPPERRDEPSGGGAGSGWAMSIPIA